MPLSQPTAKNIRPNALELFTDRVGERDLLHKLLAPEPTVSLGLTFFLTQFYGVGGVGKSMLCQQAYEIAAAEFKDTVRVVATDFDNPQWNKGSAFTEVSAELCRRLADRKIVPRLTLSLLYLHKQQTGGNGEVVAGLDAGWEMAFTAMESGADLTGIPGLGIVVKGARWVKERAHRQTLRQELTDRELWPKEQYGKLNILDLDSKLSKALYWDLFDWLKANPGQHVRLLLDGFERLQSSERREDSQQRLEQFIGSFAGLEERDACDRFRVIIFGRNQLRWDEIYEDPKWSDYWNLHLLGGLAEADAREFLRKSRTWFASKGRSALADALEKYEDKILDASEETKGGQRFFYPFYLNLAVELVERVRQSGQELELGRAPAELQDRFFRYLDENEKRALMILALSELFDERLFDWLVQERLIAYEKQTFGSKLRREHSYFVEVEGRKDNWRFHRLMENALQSRWKSTTEKTAGVNLVKRLLEYYGAPLLAKPRRDWTEADIESWRRGMEIIVRQGPELELLPHDEWDLLRKSEPWSTEHHRCATYRVDFTRRILHEEERLLGPDHPDVAKTLNNLASLLIWYPYQWAEAETLCRRALAILEKSLGSEHPDVAESINNLALLLKYTNRMAEAEPLFRRALAIREKCLSPEHLDVLASVNNLANLLKDTNQMAEAEQLYRRSLDNREKTLDANDPKVAPSLNNLANLLYRTNRLAEAEPLFRRALAIWEKNLGPEHPHVASSLNNLAGVLKDTNRLAEAEPLFRRALAIREKCLSPEHPEVANSLDNLALLLKATDRQAEAVPLWLRAEAIRNKSPLGET
jgi:tetratricopeptide (TPR) repeat protein